MFVALFLEADYAEAAIYRCFIKYVFLNISQNSQGDRKTPVQEPLLFNKVVGWNPETFL